MGPLSMEQALAEEAVAIGGLGAELGDRLKLEAGAGRGAGLRSAIEAIRTQTCATATTMPRWRPTAATAKNFTAPSIT